MVIELSDAAEKSLREIFNYYSAVAGRAKANEITVFIRNNIEMLEVMPRMAPVEQSLEGRAREYRSLVIGRRYKAVYFIDDQTIFVADIWDCRQSPVSLKERIAGFFK